MHMQPRSCRIQGVLRASSFIGYNEMLTELCRCQNFLQHLTPGGNSKPGFAVKPCKRCRDFVPQERARLGPPKPSDESGTWQADDSDVKVIAKSRKGTYKCSSICTDPNLLAPSPSSATSLFSAAGEHSVPGLRDRSCALRFFKNALYSSSTG